MKPCPICRKVGSANGWSFCTECNDHFDRWSKSRRNDGSIYAAMIWAAMQARKAAQTKRLQILEDLKEKAK